MARVFKYVRPVDAVLTNVLLGTRSDHVEKGIRIKEEPPDQFFDDLNSSSNDVDTTAQNRFTIPERQPLNVNNENNKRRRQNPNSKSDNSTAKKRKRSSLSSESRVAKQAEKVRLFVKDTLLTQTEANLLPRNESTCKICFIDFYSVASLNFHLTVYDVLLSCEICNAVFHSRRGLQLHLSSHCNTKYLFRTKYICWFCRRDFKENRHFQMHIFHSHRNLLNNEQLLETDVNKIIQTLWKAKTGVAKVVDNVEKVTPVEKSTISVTNDVDKTKKSTCTRPIPVRVTRNSERIRKNISMENSVTPVANDVEKDTPMEDSTTSATNNVDPAKENTRVEDTMRIPSDAIKVERDIWSEDAIITITSDDEFDETTSIEDIMNIIGVSSIMEEDSPDRVINDVDEVQEATRTDDIMNIVSATNKVTNINGVTNYSRNVASVITEVANVAGVTNYVADVVDASTNDANVIGVINDVGKNNRNSSNSVNNRNVLAKDATNNVGTQENTSMKASEVYITKDIIKIEEHTSIGDSTIPNIVKIEPDILAVESTIDVNQTDPNTPTKDSASSATSVAVKLEQGVSEDSVSTAMIGVDQTAPSTPRRNAVRSLRNRLRKTHTKMITRPGSVGRVSTPTNSNVSSPGRKRMRQTTLTEFISFSAKNSRECSIKLEKIDIPEESFDVSDRNTRSLTFSRTSTPIPIPTLRDTSVNTSGRNTPLIRMHMNPDSLISLLNDQIKIEGIDPFGSSVAQSSPYNLRKSTHESRRSSVDSLDAIFSSTGSRKSRPTNTAKRTRRTGLTLEERWRRKYGCKECVVRLERYEYASKQVFFDNDMPKNIIPLQLTIGKADKTSLNGKESGSPQIRIVNFDNCIVVEVLESR